MSVEGSRHRNGSKKIDFRGIFMGLIVQYSQMQIAHPKGAHMRLSQREPAGRSCGWGWAGAMQREPLPQSRVPAPAW